MSSLAILDLSDFQGPEQRRSAFLAALRTALHRDGFFYLTGHGISAEGTTRIMAMARRFFALPIEDKLTIEMVRSPHFRGYTRTGHERTHGEPDWREQLDINSEAAPYPMDAEMALAFSLLWLERLSRITTSPGLRVGAS